MEGVVMVWVAVDFDSSEGKFTEKPVRGMYPYFEWRASSGEFQQLEKGTIRKLIGYDLTWDDDAVELPSSE